MLLRACEKKHYIRRPNKNENAARDRTKGETPRYKKLPELLDKQKRISYNTYVARQVAGRIPR